MAIIKESKVNLKLKKVQFENGELIDENGEVIPNIIDTLKAVFGDRQFDLSAVYSAKSEYDLEDFAE